MDTVSCQLEKKAMLIVNPVSGKKLVIRYIPNIIRKLMDAGYMVTTFITSRRGEATEFVCRYARDFDLVCCTGGDGSLNEVLTGLAMENIDIPLGYIPCGSTNDFAISHQLPTDILTAADSIAQGHGKRYDIGRFGDNYFSYVAAFGAFSWLSYTTDQKMKNALGHTAYILDAIKDVYKIKPEHVAVTANGNTYEDDYIFGAVCNSTSIAGTIELPADLVDTADGIFEVLLVKMPETILDLNSIINSLLNKDYSNPLVTFFQASSIDIVNAPDLFWALDGERSGGYEKIHIEPINQFLNLLGR
jgi:diacylglycerol kinase (ATP)